ncbi:MAG: pilus assembly protein PilM [Patescibacteria group bacterium]
MFAAADKKNKLICSIPENKSFIKVLEMPVISEDEMTEAIKWETEDNIPLPLEKVYYDWEIIGKDQAGGKMKVLLVASPKEVIESRLEVFNAANLLALGFRPDSFVLGNLFQGLFRAEVKEEKNIAIIYFGRERSVIFIKNKTTVLFTSSILFSVTELFGKLMEAATGSLAAQDKGKIEEIKKGIREAGFLNNQELGKKHRELVGDNFEELAREIQGAITYFEAGAKEKNIEKIYLTGAGATVAGIKEWIEENLGRKIEVGGEFSGFSVDGNSLAMPMNLVCDYSIAIGCALGSI